MTPWHDSLRLFRHRGHRGAAVEAGRPAVRRVATEVLLRVRGVGPLQGWGRRVRLGLLIQRRSRSPTSMPQVLAVVVASRSTGCSNMSGAQVRPGGQFIEIHLGVRLREVLVVRVTLSVVGHPFVVDLLGDGGGHSAWWRFSGVV